MHITRGNIDGLFDRKLEEVQTILRRLADMSFLKALLRFEDINKSIERANSHLDDCSQLFPVNDAVEIDQGSHCNAHL